MSEENKGINGNNKESFASYNVIRNRLLEKSKSLRESLDKLNEDRVKIFGENIAKILKNETILTENNCIPRDIFAIGNKILLGYNVHIGLKTSINLSDVFTTYEYINNSFLMTENTLFTDPKFIQEFTDLYKYYKESFFAKFFQKNGYLYMVFQNGKDFNNIKTFKWFIKDGSLEYHGNRSTHEVIYGEQQEISWKKTTREDQVNGDFPHISIEDKIFVETVGGDLTLKIENNTYSGEGIYSEPVENKDQKLDDGEIYYVIIGNLTLLKIKPYQELKYRYLIFNEKTKEVFRVDSIDRALVLLPEGQGVLVPDAIVRQSGGITEFGLSYENVVFQEKRVSINGEDFEFIFYNFSNGEYYIYSYNIINGKANPPLLVNGFAHFDNGHFVIIKSELEPKRNHTLQIWDTSFTSEERLINKEFEGSFLFNLGNKTLVKAIAEMTYLNRLAKKEDSYYGLYVDIAKDSETIINSYFWLDKPEAYNLKNHLLGIKDAAAIAIKEFEKVSKIKENTVKLSKEIEEKVKSLLKMITYASFEKVNDYVEYLTNLRKLRGEVAGLKDLQFIDLNKVEQLAQEIKTSNDKLSEACVGFLLKPESLKSYITLVEQCKIDLEKITKVIDGKDLEKKIISISEELELLINIVNSLKITDSTKTAEIIDKISELFAYLNQAKSKLINIIENLDSKERKAEFYSKLKLVTHSVSNYLSLSDTVEKNDSYLTKLIVQLDEIESKFSDFEEFVPQLTEKREEIVAAFTTKKQNIIEAKSKKINSLDDAANRIFKGLENRLKSLEDLSLINEIFSSDLMIEKVRDIIENLISLGDTTKASEIESKLKSLKENSLRQLKDKKELFLDGNTIKFGKNNFLVSNQETELTMLKKEENFYFHITGTDFWEKIPNDILESYKEVWSQDVVSENEFVYRSEFLAFKIYNKYQIENTIEDLYNKSDESLKNVIKNYTELHYNEYYTKGVHEVDGFIILKELIKLNKVIDLAIFSPETRVIAQFFWNFGIKKDEKETLFQRLKSLNIISKYSKRNLINGITPYLKEKIEEFYKEITWLPKSNSIDVANYLAKELSSNNDFILSFEAQELWRNFNDYLIEKSAKEDFLLSLKNLKNDFYGSFVLINEWIKSYAHEKNQLNSSYFIELISLCLLDNFNTRRVVKETATIKLENLSGVHGIIENGKYSINIVDFFKKMDKFVNDNIPKFYKFQNLKTELIEDMRYKLKFHEFKPTVLTSFVRNKLINEVYLPLIGDNFAKQIGVAGNNKRTDNMGMLLLISPPGYGKTTLIEYIASRLNMLLIKINCPTLGHSITSLDPNEAPNVTAREELQKLNLAFEMGNNVIIYLDDIQHSNPEFLQKFISLCDGQRKVEGVYNSRSKSYSFRGKKVAMVMAGNPYTESGDKFQIPDMLANRADVYNLGDMLRENEEAFKLSYLENAMTSNALLNKLYMKNQEDTYKLISSIQDNNRNDLKLNDSYTESDIEDYWSVLSSMLNVRDEILKINMEYIFSAAQSDKFRVEPPFKLQGSYRNMNKITEKIVPVMNESEIKELIAKSYENDAQTLASEAEASLLKFKEITGRHDKNSETRWTQIKELYLENKKSQNGDRVVQVVDELSKIGSHIKNFSKFWEEFMTIKKSVDEN